MKSKYNNKRDINIIVKRNILIALLMICSCPFLSFSYARFEINTDSYRSNEMYISELLYSIRIDDANTYTLTINANSSEEHVIEITSLNLVSTNYKLIYKDNDNVKIEYASDDDYLVYGNIIKVNKTHIRVTNLTNEDITITFNIVGGYSFNSLDEIIIPDGYSEITNDYWIYDYETLALYVNNTKIEELDSSKYYDLVYYTCSNYTDELEVSFDADTQKLIVPINKHAKCSLYFEEIDNPVYEFNYTGSIQLFKAPKTGYYELEVWGAQGGGNSTYIGGYGGYSRGVVKLEKGETIYIAVGGAGTYQTTKSSTSVAGGYNGGGNGCNPADKYVGSGGGATSITKTNGLLSTFSSNLTNNIYEDILIVAGGGGAAGYQSSTYYGTGGSGGGYIGNNGTTSSGSTAGKGATQKSAGTSYTAGSFGKGGSSTSNGTGGGGGLYGGGGGQNYAGGGGGSGYIGNLLLISYKNIEKEMYCYNCTTSNATSTKTVSTTNVSQDAISEYAKKGNGYAKITYISTIEETIESGYSISYDSISGEQTFIVPKTGNYRLEVWGAQGGGNSTYIGGYGGYASGYVTLTEGDVIYINVGGAGTYQTKISSTSVAGGYNGGGNGYGSGDKYVGSGGGATHIATKSGLLSTLSSSLSNILIVAGGGGAAAYQLSDDYGTGGSGGGYIGNNGTTSSGSTAGKGATQTSAGTSYKAGSFGKGGSSTSSGTGGGGGLYGGGGGQNYAGGGGGSGYIGNSLLTNKVMYCYNCSTSSDTATKTISNNCVSTTATSNCSKAGNGFAKITYIGTTN